jgi:DNA polymerase III subunit alpha
VPQAHPIVQKFTAETYGIMVYQEQVMQIVHELGGIPLRAAYTLIKNISKKKQKDIDAVRPRFVEGAQQQGLSAPQADELFELILKFAGYGFNKSHSTGYAIIAYQTAYLKTYFPVQYMAAVLTYESVSTDKVVEYIDECRRVVYPDPARPRGIPVNPPDINLSEVGFTVVFEDEERDASHGHIRFGLSAVKGVGDKAIAAIIETRGKGGAFKSLYDFTERVPLGSVNRATIEALIKCGAFDALHGAQNRAAMVEGLDAAIGAGQRAASDRDSGQLNFFGGPAEASGGGDPDKDSRQSAAAPAVRLPNVPPWSNNEQLKHEKSVLGFYVSSHPLDQHRATIERFANAAATDVDRLAAEVEVVIGGILTRVRTTLVKNGRSAGQKMAMITIEDSSGPLEAVVFSDTYAVAAPLLELDRVVFIKGKVDRRRERPSVIINQVIPVERAATALTQAVRIVLREEAAEGGTAAGAGTPEAGSGGGGGAHSEAAERNRATTLHENLVRLKELLRQSTLAAGTNGHGSGSPGGGGVPVFIEIHQDGKVITVRLNHAKAAVDGDLCQRVATALYSGPCCELVGPAKVLRAGNGNVLHRDRAAASAPGFPGVPGSTGSGGSPPLPREAEEFCPSIDRY